jgi:hypothetical protein
MNKYKWLMEITVEEDDEVAAQSRIEEALEEASVDPDGLFSHGEMTKIEE